MSPPTLAVWKFTSCDGCQLTMLDCEDELLALAETVHISHFLEATSHTEPAPYDVSIVEGSVSTPDEAARIRWIREQSRTLIVIGACATSGGIQALHNFGDVDEFRSLVYAQPQHIEAPAHLDSPTAARLAADLNTLTAGRAAVIVIHRPAEFPELPVVAVGPRAAALVP